MIQSVQLSVGHLNMVQHTFLAPRSSQLLPQASSHSRFPCLAFSRFSQLITQILIVFGSKGGSEKGPKTAKHGPKMAQERFKNGYYRPY